jgi:hypothetical protein
MALEGARRELEAVHGGGLVPAAVKDTRAAGLRQLAQLQRRVGGLASVAAALPDAVGAGQSRTYLLAVLGPADLGPSGGTPLSIAVLRLDKGRMTVEEPGAAAGRTGRFGDLVTGAATSANWRTSANQLSEAYAAQFRATRPAGVIVLDTVAFAELLRVTGPIDAPPFGTLTADTLGQAPVGTSAVRFDVTLLNTVVDRLADNGRMRELANVLRPAATRRHFRLYFHDPRLQRPVSDQGLAGGRTLPGHDYLGVFTKNDSPLALLQRREIHQVVRLRPDGTADVTRTLVISATAPPLAVPRRIARQLATGSIPSVRTMLVGSVPDQATTVRLSGDGAVPADPLVVREPGLRAVAGSVRLRPGASAAYRLTYTLPRVTAAGAYRLTMDPQPFVAPAAVRLDVFAPAGRSFARGKDWVVTGGQARWSGRLDRPRTVTLRTAR